MSDNTYISITKKLGEKRNKMVDLRDLKGEQCLMCLFTCMEAPSFKYGCPSLEPQRSRSLQEDRQRTVKSSQSHNDCQPIIQRNR